MSDKVNNKIIEQYEAIEIIKNSDFIIYQETNISKSYFSNYNKLRQLKNYTCKLIRIPSIYLNYNDYDNSLKELQRREISKNVDITVSNIIEKNKNDKIVFGINHPTTFLFLEIIKELCMILIFLKNVNIINI